MTFMCDFTEFEIYDELQLKNKIVKKAKNELKATSQPENVYNDAEQKEPIYVTN